MDLKKSKSAWPECLKTNANVLNEFSIFQSTCDYLVGDFIQVRREAANIIQSCEEGREVLGRLGGGCSPD